mmetsp:Transcript_34811/g.84208  ORF Transcript_34811/g.84208 Transcript_34811/m.84208 type:complete len:221 (-) Transcript_34811:344-1006(-)
MVHRESDRPSLSLVHSEQQAVQLGKETHHPGQEASEPGESDHRRQRLHGRRPVAALSEEGLHADDRGDFAQLTGALENLFHLPPIDLFPCINSEQQLADVDGELVVPDVAAFDSIDTVHPGAPSCDPHSAGANEIVFLLQRLDDRIAHLDIDVLVAGQVFDAFHDGLEMTGFFVVSRERQHCWRCSGRRIQRTSVPPPGLGGVREASAAQRQHASLALAG